MTSLNIANGRPITTWSRLAFQMTKTKKIMIFAKNSQILMLFKNVTKNGSVLLPKSGGAKNGIPLYIYTRYTSPNVNLRRSKPSLKSLMIVGKSSHNLELKKTSWYCIDVSKKYQHAFCMSAHIVILFRINMIYED